MKVLFRLARQRVLQDSSPMLRPMTFGWEWGLVQKESPSSRNDCLLEKVQQTKEYMQEIGFREEVCPELTGASHHTPEVEDC